MTNYTLLARRWNQICQEEISPTYTTQLRSFPKADKDKDKQSIFTFAKVRKRKRQMILNIDKCFY